MFFKHHSDGTKSHHFLKLLKAQPHGLLRHSGTFSSLLRSIHILDRTIHVAPLKAPEAVQRPAVSNRSKGHTEGRLEFDYIA